MGPGRDLVSGLVGLRRVWGLRWVFWRGLDSSGVGTVVC